jgi:TonB family protein
MATQASDTANSTASKRGRGASPDDLAVVAQRAQAFTNASGVAIALSEGNADEIVCRARSGASAPDVGATLRVNGTFTGLCIQSGKELRCDDCETDTRVDTAAIRALGIRSMVVTPIREESRVIGVLAAFAPTPHAFTITHVAVLKTMADQISTLLQKERRVREEAPQAEAPRPAAPAISAKPVITATPAPAPVVPPSVVIKSSAPAPRAAAPVVSKVEPVKSLPVEVVPLATPPKKEERRVEAAPRASFGTLDSVAAEEKKPGNKLMLIGVVAVLGIAAAGTFAFLKFQKSGSQAPAQHAPEAAITQPVQPVAAAPAGNGQPADSHAAAASNPVAPAATSRAAAEPEARRTTSKPTPGTSNASTDKPAPAEKPAAVATLSASTQSRISQDSTPQPSPEVAPSFTVVSPNAGLSNLARPVATSTPSAGAIEQSQLEPLQLLRSAAPVYPAIAKARSITGTVIVQGTVGKDGKVSNLQFISGPPIFKDAAFDAVRQYQFKPAKLNGQPIEQTTQVKLIFK